MALRPQHYVGHNPAGSWAIWLILLAWRVLSGASGYAVYNDFGGELFEELHEGAANFMLAVIAVHVAGVLASSLLHGENLVKSMITGYKSGEPVLGIRRTHWLLGAGVVAGVAAFWMRFGIGLPRSGGAARGRRRDGHRRLGWRNRVRAAFGHPSQPSQSTQRFAAR
ncbi:MAG: cytochrome b/b6 domain-containing protein [Comamonadaceae bacterium]|nr:cytochrome b/b6 domain-containing protein [Comamonadaceae bacterium]